MDKTVSEIASLMAPCGFVCAYCVKHEKDGCRGCNSNQEQCPILLCCRERRIKGCWECADFPCCECTAFRSVRLRAFLRCAKEEGLDKLAEYLVRNARNGLRYHYGFTFQGDYDGYKNEEQVLHALRTGQKIARE